MKPGGPLHITLIALAIANMLPALEVEKSTGMLVLVVVCGIASILFLRKSGGRPASGWFVNIGVLASLIFLGWEMFGQHEDATVHILDLAHFVALLACCKFFECVTFRDAGLIAVICFLLMAISALVSASPVFALVLLTDLTVGVGWLMQFHARRDELAIENRTRAMAGLEPVTVVAQLGNPRTPRFLRSVASTAFILAVVATVLFVFTPRGLYGGIFGRMHGLMPSSVTGLSDVVSLQDSTIFEDPTPVLKVRFSVDGQTVKNPDFQAYLRSHTFDRYYRGKWRRTPMALPRTVVQAQPNEPTTLIDTSREPLPTNLLKQEIWLESATGGSLFAVYSPVAIDVSDVQSLRLDRKDRVLEADALNLVSRYTVYSMTDSNGPREQRIRDAAVTSRFSGFSDIPNTVAQLASDLTAPLGDSTDETHHERIAEAIESYLSSAPFEYTLRRGSQRSVGDPIEDFLFEHKRGHCEYFASAMTLMCQAVGLHARLVQGYLGGEYNASGEFFRVRKKDAHAWVEVLLPDRGWVTFDPTPSAATAPQGIDNSLMARLKRTIDFVHFRWSSWIVSFDQETREDLSTSVRSWLTATFQGDDEPRTFGEIVTALIYGPDVLLWWQRILYWAVLILAGVLIVAVVRVLWILSLFVRERIGANDEIGKRVWRRSEAQFYDRLLLLLSHKGFVKPTHVTPREFASHVASRNHDLNHVKDFTEWFYEVQYGGRELNESRWQRLKAFFSRLREDPNFGDARSSKDL